MNSSFFRCKTEKKRGLQSSVSIITQFEWECECDRAHINRKEILNTIILCVVPQYLILTMIEVTRQINNNNISKKDSFTMHLCLCSLCSSSPFIYHIQNEKTALQSIKKYINIINCKCGTGWLSEITKRKSQRYYHFEGRTEEEKKNNSNQNNVFRFLLRTFETMTHALQFDSKRKQRGWIKGNCNALCGCRIPNKQQNEQRIPRKNKN